MLRSCALAFVLTQAPAAAGFEQLRVIDGDTIHLGHEKIRLTSDAGPIDAPEIHADSFSPAKCEAELLRAAD